MIEFPSQTGRGRRIVQGKETRTKMRSRKWQNVTAMHGLAQFAGGGVLKAEAWRQTAKPDSSKAFILSKELIVHSGHGGP